MKSKTLVSFSLAASSIALGYVAHRVLYYMPYMLILAIVGCVFAALAFKLRRLSAVLGVFGFLINSHTVLCTLLRLSDGD